MNKISVVLFRKLRETIVNYAVLRNYELLPNDLGGSDLDIWVSKNDVERCLQIMSEGASETHSSLVSYTSDVNCPKLCFLKKECGIQIDLFIGVIPCKGAPLCSEDDIRKSIKEYNGIKVLDKNYGDILAFLKEVLNNGKCKEKYIEPIASNRDIYTVDYLTSHFSQFSYEFCKMLVETIKNGNYADSFSKLFAKGRKDIGVNGRNQQIMRICKLARFLKPAGYTIAVLGTDGSGKSFIINSITPILNEAFHNGIIYNHMRPNYLPSLAVATGKKKASEETHTVVSDPHASKPSGFLGSLVRLTYYWIDYTIGYLLKVFPDKSLKTHVWLFDRYYYDYYLDQRRARLNLPNWVIKMYGWFVPTPDLTICLGGDPEKIYARKPETSLEEVARQTKVLKDFCEHHKKAVWVDTTTTPEESINVAMEAIVEMMSKRFKNTKLG